REYCPVGELLPGMAYLVRRLLENTSNEGFLANKFAKGASRDELLKNPATSIQTTRPSPPIEPSGSDFINEPHTDFTIAAEREKIRAALLGLRRNLGQRHPLVINHKPVATKDWLPSLNPADQSEIVGYAAQGSIPEAEAALAAAREAQPG